MNVECLNPNDEGMTKSELQTHLPQMSRCMTSSFGLRPYFVILAFVISHSLCAQAPYKKPISVGEPPGGQGTLVRVSFPLAPPASV